MYSAIYLPDDGPDKVNPSRDGFLSEQEAWDYIFTQMCEGCRNERQLALDGKDFDPVDVYGLKPNLYPACCSEWIVCLTEEAKKSESFDDLLIAGGWQKVWKKE